MSQEKSKRAQWNFGRTFPSMGCCSVLRDMLLCHSVFLPLSWKSSFHPVNDGICQNQTLVVLELYLNSPPEVTIFNVFKVMKVPSCGNIPVVACAVPVPPVMGSGDSNCASPLLYVPLPPSCSRCIGCLVFYSFANICVFCAELVWRLHFLTQLMSVEAHLPSRHVWSQRTNCAHIAELQSVPVRGKIDYLS